MRKAVLTTIACLSASMASGQGLIISEVVDATLPGGLPKYVELTNCGNDPVDLSGFSIGNINNGATTMGFDALVLSGILAPGDSYVISYESGDSPGVGVFFDTYGFDPDNFSQGSFINGDDVLVLFAGAGLAGDPGDGTGTPVQDVYGVVGVDGTGESWEYTDGYSFRNPGATTGATFNESEWTIGGANSLEDPGGDDAIELALILSLTTPGTHDCGLAAVPAVQTVGMIALSLGLVLGAFSLTRKKRA